MAGEVALPQVFSKAAVVGVDNSRWIAILVYPFGRMRNEKGIGLLTGLEDTSKLLREPLVILIAKRYKLSLAYLCRLEEVSRVAKSRGVMNDNDWKRSRKRESVNDTYRGVCRSVVANNQLRWEQDLPGETIKLLANETPSVIGRHCNGYRCHPKSRSGTDLPVTAGWAGKQIADQAGTRLRANTIEALSVALMACDRNRKRLKQF